MAFTVAKMRETVTYCHCGQCRKMSGHVLALTRADLADITFTSDATLTWYASSEGARRGFCGQCGATLFFQPQGAEHYGIAAGCFDAPTGLRTGKHIFINDKGDYYPTPGDAPLFDGYDIPHQPGD
ncbi:MAG: GFA family protein [Pseudomonadota bacterium]